MLRRNSFDTFQARIGRSCGPEDSPLPECAHRFMSADEKNAAGLAAGGVFALPKQWQALTRRR
jgi:hypothetical protein